jgi:pimeloyl-ACP methyl ester carboxylesterase
MPTLLLGADEDQLTSPRVMEEMYKAIPHCEFVTLPGSGHGACLERPGDFMTVMIGFVVKHQQG